MSVPRRQLARQQYVLVPDDVDLGRAVPDGSWDQFTDFHRWDTPGRRATLTVQYCAADTDVATARVRTMADQSGFRIDELRAGPGLLDVQLDAAIAADVTGPNTLAQLGLPAAYPVGAERPQVRAACRRAGDQQFDAGEGLVAVRPAEPQVSVGVETLVALPARTLSVTRRRSWRDW